MHCLCWFVLIVQSHRVHIYRQYAEDLVKVIPEVVFGNVSRGFVHTVWSQNVSYTVFPSFDVLCIFLDDVISVLHILYCSNSVCSFYVVIDLLFAVCTLSFKTSIYFALYAYVQVHVYRRSGSWKNFQCSPSTTKIKSTKYFLWWIIRVRVSCVLILV